MMRSAVTTVTTAVLAAAALAAMPALAGATDAVHATHATGAAHATTATHTAHLPPTTPAGVTLVEVVRELNASAPKFLWLRPGDADGHTLLVFDHDQPRKSTCAAACARQFPPLLASHGAKAFGDWSLVHRSDGSLQWAYQSRPLYTWVKEHTPGEVATNVGLSETSDAKLAEVPTKAGALLPPADWQVARFTPAASMRLPDGIDAQLVDSAQAVALVDDRGLTLYQFDGDARRDGQGCGVAPCRKQWLPIAAPSLAGSIGNFSIVSRADGSRQWAYKGRPLYEYVGDQLPGDAHGIGVDPKFHLAALTQDFTPPQVAVRTLNGYGDALAFNGMTLYGSYPFEKRWGGRNLRDNFSHSAYYKGKQLGAAGCIDAACLQHWQPLRAPADAQADGFWEPIARPDGSKQWAYKGYALYTYAGDQVAGAHSGQATYDFHHPEGSYSYFKYAVFLADVARAPGGAGIYWNIAHP
jgi:predicted lipoprotein with Yx(FWY)xxD motif